MSLPHSFHSSFCSDVELLVGGIFQSILRPMVKELFLIDTIKKFLNILRNILFRRKKLFVLFRQFIGNFICWNTNWSIYILKSKFNSCFLFAPELPAILEICLFYCLLYISVISPNVSVLRLSPTVYLNSRLKFFVNWKISTSKS